MGRHWPSIHSSATLPITFKCLLENNHIDLTHCPLVLPVKPRSFMDGTALLRLWLPSSLPRSTTTSWTLARSSLSGVL